jgi:hypothetical protein
MADNSIESAVERYLSALPESDWQALRARVRPPGADWREFFAEHELVDTEPDEPQNLIVPKEVLTPHPGPISDEHTTETSSAECSMTSTTPISRRYQSREIR